MRTSGTDCSSPLAVDIQAFLKYKRALGCKYHNEDKALRLFGRFLVEEPIDHSSQVDSLLVEKFLASRQRDRPRSFNHLLSVISRFFAWMVSQGHLTVSPVRSKPRRQTSTRLPFLFSPGQARKLLTMARELPDNNRALRRGPTYYMIFALIYGLGLRVSEAAKLTREDVDTTRDLLIVRETKFGKTRLVPFGPRIAERLRNYLETRPAAGPIFSFTGRDPVHPGTISQTFSRLWPRLGLEIPAGVSEPTVHGLRHAFAVETLLRWYREGIDPSRRLLQLSTFLGHVHPSSTAVYLTMTEQLLEAANERFEKFALGSEEELGVRK